MSQEEELLSHGRLVREYSETKKRVVALKSDLRRAADLLKIVSEQLSRPEPTAVALMFRSHKEELPSHGYIRQLVDEYAEKGVKLQDLRSQLSHLGLDIKNEF